MLMSRQAASAHRVMLSLLVFAAIGGCGVALALRSPVYQATAQIVVTPMTADQVPVGMPVFRDLGDPIRTIETAAALLNTRQAAQQAAAALGRPWTADSVAAGITVQPQGQTNLIEVVAHAARGGDAAKLANAYTLAALAQRKTALAASATDALTTATRQLAQSPPGAAGDLARARLASLQQLLTDGDPSAGVAQAALAPTSPSGLPATLVLGLAAIAGLLTSLAVALMLRDPAGVAVVVGLAAAPTGTLPVPETVARPEHNRAVGGLTRPGHPTGGRA